MEAWAGQSTFQCLNRHFKVQIDISKFKSTFQCLNRHFKVQIDISKFKSTFQCLNRHFKVQIDISKFKSTFQCFNRHFKVQIDISMFQSTFQIDISMFKSTFQKSTFHFLNRHFFFSLHSTSCTFKKQHFKRNVLSQMWSHTNNSITFLSIMWHQKKSVFTSSVHGKYKGTRGDSILLL